MDTMQIRIATEARPNVEKTLARLERMPNAEDSLFAALVVEEYTRTHVIKVGTKQQPLTGTVELINRGKPSQQRVATFRYHDLTLTMSPLSDDWDLLYTVGPTNPEDPHLSPSIVKVNPMAMKDAKLAHIIETTMPPTFTDHCDHCTSGRRGRQGEAFRHKDNEEIVHVGSSCVCLEGTPALTPLCVESILEFKGKATTHDFDTGKRGVVRSMTTYEFALRASMARSTPTSPTPEASATPCLTGNSSRTRRRAKSASATSTSGPVPCTFSPTLAASPSPWTSSGSVRTSPWHPTPSAPRCSPWPRRSWTTAPTSPAPRRLNTPCGTSSSPAS